MDARQPRVNGRTSESSISPPSSYRPLVDRIATSPRLSLIDRITERPIDIFDDESLGSPPALIYPMDVSFSPRPRPIDSNTIDIRDVDRYRRNVDSFYNYISTEDSTGQSMTNNLGYIFLQSYRAPRDALEPLGCVVQVHGGQERAFYEVGQGDSFASERVHPEPSRFNLDITSFYQEPRAMTPSETNLAVGQVVWKCVYTITATGWRRDIDGRAPFVIVGKSLTQYALVDSKGHLYHQAVDAHCLVPYTSLWYAIVIPAELQHHEAVYRVLYPSTV